MTNTTQNLDVIAENAILVRLSIEVWQGTKYDKSTARELEGVRNADKESTMVIKSLVPRKMVRTMIATLRAARRECESVTLPWGGHGLRLLPVKQFDTFIAKMDEQEADFEREKEAFLAEYETLKDPKNAKRRLGTMYRAEDFPETDWVRSRFNFRIEYLPVPLADDLRVALDKEAEARVNSSIAEANSRQAAVAMRGICYQLHALIDNLHGQLTDDNSRCVRPRTYDALEELVALMPSLNVIGDPILADVCRELQDNVLSYSRRQIHGVDRVRASATKIAQNAVKKLDAHANKLTKSIGDG